MDIKTLTELINNNAVSILITMTVIILVMLILIINTMLELSRLKKRQKKLMTGVDGDNLERMLLGQIDATRQIENENARLNEENRRIDALLQQAVTRVGVVRFCAFEDMGSDLSYAVALLDSYNNGVVLSSLFGREDSRSYAKPIKDGHSTYTLTKEEEQALKDAMSKK